MKTFGIIVNTNKRGTEVELEVSVPKLEWAFSMTFPSEANVRFGPHLVKKVGELIVGDDVPLTLPEDFDPENINPDSLGMMFGGPMGISMQGNKL